jgi:hypothetical protein
VTTGAMAPASAVPLFRRLPSSLLQALQPAALATGAAPPASPHPLDRRLPSSLAPALQRVATEAAAPASAIPLERRLPSSLLAPATSGGGGSAVNEALENKAAMQAVVDALSVCSTEPAQPPSGSLRVQLLPHQALALGWMLSREGSTDKGKKHSPSGGILADDQVRVLFTSRLSFRAMVIMPYSLCHICRAWYIEVTRVPVRSQ